VAAGELEADLNQIPVDAGALSGVIQDLLEIWRLAVHHRQGLES
jgi:hypothetical protein